MKKKSSSRRPWKPQREVPLTGVKITYKMGKAYSWWGKKDSDWADKVLGRLLRRLQGLHSNRVIDLDDVDGPLTTALKEEIVALKMVLGRTVTRTT